MIVANYLNLVNGPKMIVKIVGHAVGHCDEYTRIVVPADQFRRVVWEARVFLLLLVGALVAAIELGTIVPLLFVGLPSFYGAWFMWFCAVTQHAGLREDVLDHRMSTRTVYINPVLRFLYLNMNYHLEHHLFPAVPYYNLPALHEEVKAFLPPPKTSMLDAYREIFRTLRAQRRDPSYELDRGWTPPPELLEASARVVADVAPDRSGTTDLGPVTMLEPGDLTELEIGGRPFLLCRMPDGAYAMADGMCTHGRAKLADGFFDECIIECPKHNGRFDLRTGEAVRFPARDALAIYSVREDGGRIVVDSALLAPTPPQIEGIERPAADAGA
jgi:nitrite reductase/ring-hydroxylating ferredoxin subunit